MLQILQYDSEILIRSGFIYLPLLVDRSIDEEINRTRKDGFSAEGGRAGNPDIIEARGRRFIKSLGIASLLSNYEKLDADTFEYLRRNVFTKFLRTLSPGSLSIDEDLRAIIFQVMPHFIRKKNRLRRGRTSGEEILDLILRKIDVPARYYREAGRLSDISTLRGKLGALERSGPPDAPPLSGFVSSLAFRQWFFRALEARILEEEKKRLGNVFYNRELFATLQKKYIAVLLFVQERGALEVNGCGFFRNGSEYLVYVRTGPYALKDYYGRIYLFPDCRVAASTIGPIVPYVVDIYKHPFLRGYDRMQKICVRGDFIPAQDFSAEAAVQALEEGIGALYHGYNSKRGNGYNRLEGMMFEHTSIVFEDYRIAPDDPRIVSGAIEVKNDFY